MRRRIRKLFSPEPQATAKGILIDLLNVAKESTGFVPGTGLIFGGVLLILEGLDKSAENAQLLEELRKHIESLQGIFVGSEGSDVSTETNKEIEKLKEDLQELTDKLKGKASHSRSKRFMNRRYDEGDLRLLSDSINSSLIRYRTSRELRLEKEKKQEELSRLLDKLPAVKDASFDSTNRANAPVTCFEDTRVDVLKRIQDWIEAPDDGKVPPIFWVNGLAGVGKSTIAQTVAQRNSGEGLLVASFFFSRMEAARSHSTLVLPTIAYQLAHLNDNLKHRIADAVKNGNITDVRVLSTQMEKLIVEPLLNVQLQRKLVIVLDALDECDSEGATELLRLLLSPPQKFPLSIRILITSRPEYHIRAVFNEPLNLEPAKYSKFVLHLDIEDFVVHKDIGRFLRASLQHLPEVLGIDLPKDWIEDAQLEALAARAGRSFVYCATAIRFIGNPVMPDPQRRLNMLLDTDSSVAPNAPYAELDRLYAQVLSNALQESVNSHIPESFHRRYQSIVGSILFLRDPLPLKSLARFTKHQVADIDSTLFVLRPIIVAPRGGEPPWINNTSFLDFVIDPKRCVDPRLCIDRSNHERWLAIRCLELLTTNLKRDLLGTDDLSLYNEEIQDLPARVKDAIPPELRYACLHWASHLIVVESSDAELLNLLETFASKYALNWFEAMSLLESVSVGVSSIRDAYEWAVKMNCGLTIKALLLDAYRFAVANMDIIESAALHVYRLHPSEPRDLTGQVTWSQSDRIGQGGYSIAYSGVWRRRGPDKTGEVKVVVKELIWNNSNSPEQLERRLKREVLLWQMLQHRNIVEFLGFLNFRSFNRPAAGLVSRLYVNGNVNTYLESHSLSISEKQTLCCDVASGLGYLHSLNPPVIHGDLKPGNVLVDEEGRAALCDFGMARILGDVTGLTAENIFAGSLLYLAPETYDAEDDALTTERDVYAFGCVCVEIIIQKCPFTHSVGRNIYSVFMQKLPPYTSDDLLNVTFLPGVLGNCFNLDAKSRPTMPHILQILGNNNGIPSYKPSDHELPEPTYSVSPTNGGNTISC